MNRQLLLTAMDRRTLLCGFLVFGASTPSMAAAQGGLKGGDDDRESDDEFAAIGVTGEHTYESPQFGYRLEWDRHWFVPEDDPGRSSEAEQWDTLYLRWAETPSPSVAAVQLSFDGFIGMPQTTDSWLAGMADPDTLTEFFGAGGEEAFVALVAEDVNIQEVVWRLQSPNDPDDSISMVSAYRVLDDGLILMSTLAIIDLEELTDSIASLIDDVTLDDEPLMQLLSLEDIEAAFATLD